MKFEQRMTQRLEQEQALKIRQKLELKLDQKIGEFEKQVLEKVKFVDINLGDQPYHADMLGMLLVRESEDETSLLGSVVETQGLSEKDIQEIIVETYQMKDVSFDIGTRRNVDIVTIILEDGTEFSMTVSLDKEAYKSPLDSPTYKEHETLKDQENSNVPAFQKLYGHTNSEDGGGFRSLICKEYIPGTMLENITHEIDGLMEGDEGVVSLENQRSVADATGRMIGATLRETGGIPSDSNGFNIIINDSEEDPAHPYSARYCDTEELRIEEKGIVHELRLLKSDFKSLETEFLKAVRAEWPNSILDTL
jgi:hypothetical protein